MVHNLWNLHNNIIEFILLYKLTTMYCMTIRCGTHRAGLAICIAYSRKTLDTLTSIAVILFFREA